LFDGFPETFPVFQWHGDTFSIPEGGKRLVEGNLCPNQAFRLENVIGLQFHLETTGEDIAPWADKYHQELTEFGKTEDQIIAECSERERERQELATLLIKNFIDIYSIK